MVWVYIIAAVVIYLILDRLIRLPTVGKYGERYVFITGCDTGFGNMLAKRLDSLGLNVFAACLTERGEDELRKESSSRLKTISLDVSKPESVAKARETVEKLLPPSKGLWALVNNAGVVGTFGPSEWLTRRDYDTCLNVNLFGIINVTKGFLPLVRKGQGRIVNMSSIAGIVPVGGYPYGISKYGVEAFSDMLRREVIIQGITVHIIEPGTFKTNISNPELLTRSMQRSFDESSPDVKLYYGKTYVEEGKKVTESLIKKIASEKTYLVVDAYTHAVTAMFPRYRYLVGNDAKYLIRLLSYLPEWISDRFLIVTPVLPDGVK